MVLSRKIFFDGQRNTGQQFILDIVSLTVVCDIRFVFTISWVVVIFWVAVFLRPMVV